MTTTALRRFSVLCVLSTVVLAWSGCSLLPEPKSDPTRYYVLTGQSLELARPAKAEGGLVLGVKRIEIAAYLNGKDMVVRAAGNEIAYQSFARWAEPLTASISRAISGRLASADTVGRVYPQPFPFDVERDYDVAIRVFRCEGEHKTDGAVVASFSALVEVTQAKAGGAVVMRKVFVAPPVKWDGKDFGALAAALSEDVAALGAEVVAALPAK